MLFKQFQNFTKQKNSLISHTENILKTKYTFNPYYVYNLHLNTVGCGFLMSESFSG